jgi:hypothetical protein
MSVPVIKAGIVPRYLCARLLWGVVALVLGACSKAPPIEQPRAGFEPPSVDDIPYRRLVGAATFQRIAAYEQQGYHVESGTLKFAGNRDGVLLTVRCPDHTLLAWVDAPGAPNMSGTWTISPQGASTFINTPRADVLEVHGIIDPGGMPKARAVPNADGTYTIDVLAGYSRAAAAMVDDPIAHALLQVELANLGLRRSAVSVMRLRLADVQIIDEDFGIVAPVLARLSGMFQHGARDSGADLIAGYSAGHSATARGWGRLRGDLSVNWIDSPAALAQALAYNLGMNPDTAGAAGDWQHQAQRLASYAPSLEGERMIVASLNADTSATLSLATRGADRPVGIVVMDGLTQGPRQLDSGSLTYTRLVAKLADRFGNIHDVVLRGERLTACSVRGLPFYRACTSGESALRLRISLVASDNPTLAQGMLTGKMVLRALDPSAPDWGTNVTVLLSVNRSAETQHSLLAIPARPRI